MMWSGPTEEELEEIRAQKLAILEERRKEGTLDFDGEEEYQELVNSLPQIVEVTDEAETRLVKRRRTE